jgi:hypothetical protein
MPVTLPRQSRTQRDVVYEPFVHAAVQKVKETMVHPANAAW